MTAFSLAFLGSLVLALALTPLVAMLARAVGAVDSVGESNRRVHVVATPRLGGLAIVVAFYAPLLALLFVDSSVGRLFAEDPPMVLGLLLGGLGITCLGIYDDIFGANAAKKFSIQFAVAIALYLIGFRIDIVSTPFGPPVVLGVLAAPITCLWIVGIINAINLIDGLDGLASGVAFLAGATTLVVALVSGQILMTLFMACLTGALLGFLVYNFNPAKIFMGDTGSMFLGFVLAVTTVQTNSKSQATVALLVPVLALGLPIMDTTLAMTRRFLTGRQLFSADRGHLHHRLLDRGLSHRTSVLVMYGVSVMLCLAALAIVASSRVSAALGALLAALTVSVVLVRWLHDSSSGTLREQARGLRGIREYHRMLLQRARESETALATADSLGEIWEAAIAASGPLAPSSMYLLGLDLGEGSGSHRQLCVWRGGDANQQPGFSVAYPIDLGDATVAVLELYWEGDRRALTDAELSHLELLVERLGKPLAQKIDHGRRDMVVVRSRARTSPPASEALDGQNP